MLIPSKAIKLFMLIIMAVSFSMVSIESYSADFTGKIKRIKIKKRGNSSNFRMIITGGNLQTIDSAEVYIENGDLLVNNPITIVPKTSKEGKKLVMTGFLQFKGDTPSKLPLTVNLYDEKENLLLSEYRSVEIETRPDAKFFNVSLKNRKTAEKVYSFYTAAPELESLHQLYQLSDMSTLGYMEAKEVSEEEFKVLTPEKINYATGTFDPFGNLIRLVSEDGIVLTFESAKQESVDDFGLSGDWNASWKSAFRSRDKKYKSKSGTLTINIYSSDGGG